MMLGGEKGSVAFHGDHRPAKVATHRRSRNLWASPFPVGWSRTVYGVTITQIENGGIQLNGTATNSFQVYTDGVIDPKISLDGGVHTLSVKTDSEAVEGDAGAQVQVYSSSTERGLSWNINPDFRNTTANLPSADDYILRVRIQKGCTYDNVVYYPQIEVGEIATDYEPYGTIEQVISEPAESTQDGTMLTFDRTYNHVAEVSVFGESTQETLTGKNLWCFSQSYSSEEGRYSNWIANNTPFSLNAGTYTVSATEKNLQDSAPLFGYLQDGTRIELIRFYANTKNDNLSNTFTISQPITSVWFVANAGVSVKNIQLEAGSTATTYEPYCGGIPAPNPSYPMPIVSRASACVETRGKTVDFTITPQLELGSTATDYQPYRASTTDLTALLNGRELRSLPDGTRDEVQVRDNGDGTGDVVLVERVGVVTPTGYKAADSLLDGGAACKLAYTPDIDGMKTSNWGSGVCDMYANGNGTKTANVFRIGDNDTTIYLYLTGFDSNDDTSAYLEANKPTFYYPLAIPTETVLGTITMPETFYDVTNVWEANGADISARVKVFG